MAKQDMTGGSGGGAKGQGKSGGKPVRADAEVETPKSFGDRIADLKEFFEQSQNELKKVVWPSRKETVATSMAVVIVVTVMSVFLWVVDSILTKIIKAVLS